MAKPYFTREAYFTNPQGFISLKKASFVIKTKDAFFMACLKGFEPLTFWFVAKHSIRLSYRHMALFQTT